MELRIMLKDNSEQSFTLTPPMIIKYQIDETSTTLQIQDHTYSKQLNVCWASIQQLGRSNINSVSLINGNSSIDISTVLNSDYLLTYKNYVSEYLTFVG